ncbi:hypothetical protein ACFYNY_24790 [Streptomyces sp. NPDC006530]|uniref:hypothetical protein n=1 Tax=Streptomyces sp. NPDC006530 TaxID=3364750 RepID=UPI0036CEE3F8
MSRAARPHHRPEGRRQTAHPLWHGRPGQRREVLDRPAAEGFYNLTVSKPHTYYVLAGNTSGLVHNDDKNLCKLLGISQMWLSTDW